MLSQLALLVKSGCLSDQDGSSVPWSASGAGNTQWHAVIWQEGKEDGSRLVATRNCANPDMIDRSRSARIASSLWIQHFSRF